MINTKKEANMEAYNNILVPTDFFEGFDKALKHAKSIAKLMNSTIYVVHVIEPSLYPTDFGFSQISLMDIENEILQNSKIQLEAIVDDLKKEGINAECEVLFGRASDRIIDFAEEKKVDLICISTHGRSSLDKMIFGSTTEKVLRRAKCPILSIRV